jgi:hypothetical protein
MSTNDAADPISVIITLLLTASLVMEDTSAELVLPTRPRPQQLAEKVQLLEDTAGQLSTLAEAARAALRQDRP